MISEDQMYHLIKDLKGLVDAEYSKKGGVGHYEAIDLIPLGWQVANNQEDSRVGVALENDDG